MLDDAESLPFSWSTSALRLLRSGPADPEWLARCLANELGDARITAQRVCAAIDSSTLLVGRPDGLACRFLDLLEGQTLTHRVTASTTDRRDLWTDLSLLPFQVCAEGEPLPLAGGGEVTRGTFAHDALVGPEGWLPDVPRGGLIALTWEDGALRISACPDSGVPVARDAEVRGIVGRHVREQRWWSGWGSEDELDRRPELARALAHALLEDPQLFTDPVGPLDEVLHGILAEYSRQHLVEDTAAWEAGEVVSFSVAGMPEALYGELSRRATKFGMSFDRFVVATLGHTAWRTPFAENLGPWEDWTPREPQASAPPTVLRPVPTPTDHDSTG
ncbi:hypothetical protein [Serinicoccus kebangsaanensis]|uniref:hypothetical protein n=1 Tax=Serinicoccus kebangsaanensis TaxID=2602069 RepID=UPI00124E7885|nr:hypothetical protein [Serinicoccus kebangsaanensis]